MQCHGGGTLPPGCAEQLGIYCKGVTETQAWWSRWRRHFQAGPGNLAFQSFPQQAKQPIKICQGCRAGRRRDPTARGRGG
mmetsp:Transcript_78761/g.231083  ORF Transcript_78761/g.231083 Transcript_78761/m.231083 type:complete len:80 (-) Transcript_78761:995-1234(-)